MMKTTTAHNLRWFAACLALICALRATGETESVTGVVSASRPVGVPRWELTPSLSILTPMEVTLDTPERSVDYPNGLTAMPSVQLSAARRLGNWNGLNFQLQGTVAYASKGGILPTVAADGTRGTWDDVNIRWIPMLASLKTSYQIPSFTFLRPSLTLGVGGLYFSQSAPDPRLQRSALLPALAVTPSFTLTDGPNPGDWFGGVVFGSTFLFGLGPESHVRSMGIDVGLNIIL